MASTSSNSDSNSNSTSSSVGSGTSSNGSTSSGTSSSGKSSSSSSSSSGSSSGRFSIAKSDTETSKDTGGSSSSSGSSSNSSYSPSLSYTRDDYSTETANAHDAGISGPGLSNGAFGSSWSAVTNNGATLLYGNGKGSTFARDTDNGRTSSYSDGTYIYTEDNRGNVYATRPDGTQTYIGTINSNGSFIGRGGLSPEFSAADVQKARGEAQESLTGSSTTSKTDKNGSSITDVSNINETPSTKAGTQVMSGVHDSDVESSTTSGGSANGNIPTESGYNNDKAKNEVEQQFKNIDADTDENKTNYNKDTFNYGMKDVSTDAVSDERCKKFVSNCIRHEPFARKGVKKIVEIIRSK